MTLNPTNVSIIKRLLVGRNSRPLRSILSRLAPPDLASLLGMLNDRERRLLLDALLHLKKAAACLTELPDQKLSNILGELDSDFILKLLTSADEDEAFDLLNAMDEVARIDYLDRLEAPTRHRFQQLLNYEEDTAGRMMVPQVFTVPVGYTADECLRYLREKAGELSIYYIYCVDENSHLVGVVSLRDLTTASLQTPLLSLAKKEVVTVKPETPSEEVARIVGHYDFVAVPVVGEENELLGVITVDDVLDIIQDQATANIYASAGLQEDDRVYSPPSRSIKNRLPWMLLNLFLAAVASSVISIFEDTMSELIILASLNNIVAGMAGNTAIQTLTVVTRGIAIGDFTFISRARGILKELFVGMSIGLLTGVVAGAMVYFWKDSTLVAIVICVSMFLNSIVAAILGSGVPLIMKKMKIDPAAGSGVIVTMVTDIFGFFSFLMLAQLGLKIFGA